MRTKAETPVLGTNRRVSNHSIVQGGAATPIKVVGHAANFHTELPVWEEQEEEYPSPRKLGGLEENVSEPRHIFSFVCVLTNSGIEFVDLFCFSPSIQAKIKSCTGKARPWSHQVTNTA